MSRKPRQQRISSRKMYKRSLPSIHVKSMKNFNGKVRLDRKASLPRGQTPNNESSAIITSAEFPYSTKGLRHCSEHSDLYGCMGDRYENGTYQGHNSISNRSESKRKVDSSRVLSWGKCLRNGYGLRVIFLLSLLFVCANGKTVENQTNQVQTGENGTVKTQSDGTELDDQCALGIRTPGRTWPRGDIVLEYGQPLRIYCMLNKTLTDLQVDGRNASDLVFFRHDKKMEPEYVTVLNETTSMMYVEQLSPSEDMYYCKLRSNNGHGNKYDTVCLNKVIVGYKPLEPLDFTCVSQNWENLTCTWYPAPNYIATKFTLGFKLPGRGGRLIYRCPNTTDPHKQPPNTCTWSASTDPMYRQVYEYLTFILTVENVLGTKSFEYRFHHYAHVIPAKPEDLLLINKTHSSVMLHWKIPNRMMNFPPGIFSRISYQSQYDNKDTWKVINITDYLRARVLDYNLTNLEYANTVYDIRVFIKSAKAIGDDSWSKFSDITVRTADTLPGRPPRTDIGSFEIAGNSKTRDVYIYWQTIPAYLQNGDNFTYEIVRVEENGKLSDRKPSEKKDTYAKFKEISFESFKFEIVAANVRGESEQRAVVHVPRQSDKPPEPVSFTKIAYDNAHYELSWEPMSNPNITNYTIYWCENDRDRPYQCNGYLDWTHVPPNISIYNTTVPDSRKTYQFAIAANTAVASSGMVWASCTAIHNTSVGKMQSVWISEINPHKIRVGWRLECSDRIDIIIGFVIYYCPIVSPYNVSCKDPMMNTTVEGNSHTTSGDVTGLKPYTTYKLAVAVLTKNGEGHHSDPLYNTTLEAAPGKPQRVKVTNVTNTTMNIEWEPPTAINGMLKYYTVYYDANVTKVENGSTRLQIQNLKPYHVYNITVSAWTASEGNRSDPIIQKTDIGIPGKTEAPKVRFENLSQVNIKWDPPRSPGGNLDFYEILTVDNEIHTNITTCDTECVKNLAIPDCSSIGRGKSYKFQVRAVNYGQNLERFEGPWSDPGEGNCFSSGPSALVWVVIWIIGCFSGVAFLMFLGYSSKRIWIKCKAMQDVEVKLPPGLQPNTKLLGQGNDQHAQQQSADSSGCSSGQESVTSSLTSDSHVSTDSGADLDPVPMSPTKLLESPPTWESSSLRQRYVSGSTKPDSSGDRGRWDHPYVKVSKNTDTTAVDALSLARSTPNLTDGAAVITAQGLYPESQQPAWSSTGYISMPSSEEDSSNNPSPLPRGKGSAQGVYSVVGLAPSSMPRARAGAEGIGAERNHPRTADLIPLEPEARMEPVVANPYVSLASLEQKNRGGAGVKPQISSLGDFAGIEFVHQVREQQQQQQQQQQPPPPPYSISDKLSKPYVQAGLFDATKMPRPAKEPTTVEPSSGRPPFASNFSADPSVSVSQSLIELPSNSYVPVDTARGTPSARANKEPAQVQNPYVAVSTLVSPSEGPFLTNRRTDGAEDNSASSYPFEPQLIDTSNTNTLKLADCDDPVTRSATSGTAALPVVKQSTGYVTIAENPTRTGDNSTLQGSALSYVPHQQANKKSPPPGYQQNVGQADEQYSKVTVVPTTT